MARTVGDAGTALGSDVLSELLDQFLDERLLARLAADRGLVPPVRGAAAGDRRSAHGGPAPGGRRRRGRRATMRRTARSSRVRSGCGCGRSSPRTARRPRRPGARSRRERRSGGRAAAVARSAGRRRAATRGSCARRPAAVVRRPDLRPEAGRGEPRRAGRLRLPPLPGDRTRAGRRWCRSPPRGRRSSPGCASRMPTSSCGRWSRTARSRYNVKVYERNLPFEYEGSYRDEIHAKKTR